mmetsp:Transcript_14728/g.24800  ORF Transcript_14728/g.24800 Transcript_14728/m.24800 type:complete len:262 (+) Transcript_14728:121-906(+)
MGKVQNTLALYKHQVCLYTLNAIFYLSVQLLQTLNVLLGSFPVTSSVSLKECGNHITEGIGVGVEKSLLHLGIIDEDVVGIFEDEVIDFSSGGGPSHGISKTLLDLTDTFVSGGQHTLVELRVEKLGSSIKTDSFGESTNLGVGSGGISHQRHRLFLVVTKSLDNLGRIGIIVVRNIGDRNLGRVQVLEGNINSLQGGLEKIGLLFHHTRLVGVEGKSLTSEELFLKLTFVFPSSILDSKSNVGRVRSGRVGEDTAGGLTD